MLFLARFSQRLGRRSAISHRQDRSNLQPTSSSYNPCAQSPLHGAEPARSPRPSECLRCFVCQIQGNQGRHPIFASVMYFGEKPTAPPMTAAYSPGEMASGPVSLNSLFRGRGFLPSQEIKKAPHGHLAQILPPSARLLLPAASLARAERVGVNCQLTRSVSSDRLTDCSPGLPRVLHPQGFSFAVSGTTMPPEFFPRSPFV